ncbi:MAG: tetratricopeptide (TPR) repeat protein, partial [Kiritimatiellia bacterium]
TWALIALGMALSWVDWWGVRSEDLRDIEYARLSNAAWRGGAFDTSLSYADKAIELNTKNPQIQQLRGQALYGVGRIQEAAEAYEKAILTLPTDYNSRYNLGRILYRDFNDPDRAMQILKKAGHGMDGAAWLRARILIRAGKLAEAEKILTLPFGPGLQEIWNEIEPRGYYISAICLAFKKGDQETVENFRKQLETDFGQPAMDELAWELGQIGYRP